MKITCTEIKIEIWTNFFFLCEVVVCCHNNKNVWWAAKKNAWSTQESDVVGFTLTHKKTDQPFTLDNNKMVDEPGFFLT